MAEETKKPEIEEKKIDEVKEEKTQAEELEDQEKAEAALLGGKQEVEGEEAKEKRPKKERTAVLYIQTTKNNTVLTLTDMAGNTITRSSGGQSTKQARLKSSPTIAMFAAKKISEEAKEHNITSLYVRIKAETGEGTPSSASHAVIKALSREDFKIISILDITRYPRGGPKKAGGRRGRRV